MKSLIVLLLVLIPVVILAQQDVGPTVMDPTELSPEQIAFEDMQRVTPTIFLISYNVNALNNQVQTLTYLNIATLVLLLVVLVRVFKK